MDNRKDALRSVKVCRFCLTEDSKLSNIYDRSRVQKNAVTLPLQILACVSIEVFPSDGMPTQICDRCRFFMDASYHFKQICRQAEESIMQFLENGEPLEPITWPSKLLKLFPSNNESAGAKESVKTLVTESGTCVQVQTDSEEDGNVDEKVYNIKIESDGSQSLKKGSSFRVITGDEKIQLVNNDVSTKEKSYSSGPKLARHVRTHTRGSEYPCKYCSKVFFKSHHYTRHLRLKHKDIGRLPRPAVNDSNSFRCDQCEEAFTTQDDLIYHSAYHATQNLICPLCQEKFDDVDAVTTHIKSHVDSEQYMCDLCELVFTSQERLDNHVASKHEDELREEQLQESDHADEESMEMEPDEADEDQNFSLKEEGDHMVVEIKKPNEFTVTNVTQVPDGKSTKITEGNETEMTYTELATVDTLAIAKQQQQVIKAKHTINSKLKNVAAKHVGTPIAVVTKSVANTSNETASILQKAEDVKRKTLEQKETRLQPPNKDKSETSSSSTGTSDKSLRLLEKELRELQRTSNARNETGKATTPVAESMRGRRPQVHTSTPKPRNIESKKLFISGKAVEKRSLERIPTIAKENKEIKESKDNKESKENRESKNNNNTSIKEDKEPKEQKQKMKNLIEKASSEESTRRPSRDDSVRRSSRPSKIRDYAKMIREGTQVSDNDDDDYESEDDDEEYGEEPEPEPRGRLRRTPAKPAAAPTKPAESAPPTAPRKRGRPRKTDKKRPPSPEVTKTKKLKQEPLQDIDEDNDRSQQQIKKTEKKEKSSDNDYDDSMKQKITPNNKGAADDKSTPSTPTSGTPGEAKGSPMLLSPTGQTLKKIPVKALPPGIKPLPLPANARPMGQLCEMQIGEKVMKVQKIVMTKEKVEQLAKQGLIEVKAGTMVLKTGYKLATPGDSPVKATPSTPDNKDFQVKREKPAPTRCDLQEES